VCAPSHSTPLSPSLAKLRNTKTSDNKSTLLHYIAEVISERSPELLKLREELHCCSDAAKGACARTHIFIY
jgi:hypothetical protein